MGDGGHHRQKPQRAGQPRGRDPDPGQEPGQHIGPKRQPGAAVPLGGICGGRAAEDAPHDQRGQRGQHKPGRADQPKGLGQPQDQQRKDVGRNRDQKQQMQRRMAGTKHPAADQKAQHHVRAKRHLPAGRKPGLVRGDDQAGGQDPGHPRPDQAAQRQPQGQQRLASAQGAAVKHQRLPQLFADEEQEQRHQRLGHQRLRRHADRQAGDPGGQVKVKQSPFDHVVVAGRGQVDPERGQHGPPQKRAGKAGDKGRDAIHAGCNRDGGRSNPLDAKSQLPQWGGRGFEPGAVLRAIEAREDGAAGDRPDAVRGGRGRSLRRGYLSQCERQGSCRGWGGVATLVQWGWQWG